jgi:hypothetical protein
MNKAREAWEEFWRQEIPPGYYVHHIDRDVTNNEISNLLLVTASTHQLIHAKDKLFPPKPTFCFRIRNKMLKKLQYFAQKEDVKPSELIRIAIDEFIEKMEEKHGKERG